MKKNKILVGTRASKLAMIYANRAKYELSKVFSGEIELINITTDGDKDLKNRLSDIGGKATNSGKPSGNFRRTTNRKSCFTGR